MNTRQIATEVRLSQWAGIMQERLESGLSVKAFCDREGFHENKYFYWQRKLREAACEQLSGLQPGSGKPSLASSSFMEVKLQSSGKLLLSNNRQRDPGKVRFEFAGLHIAADSNYPPEHVALLIRRLVQI